MGFNKRKMEGARRAGKPRERPPPVTQPSGESFDDAERLVIA